jgi:hypothetical protein
MAVRIAITVSKRGWWRGSLVDRGRRSLVEREFGGSLGYTRDRERERDNHKRNALLLMLLDG